MDKLDSLVKKTSLTMRKKRYLFFASLIDRLPRPLNIIDIGGTQGFWEKVGMRQAEGINICLFNIRPITGTLPGFISVVGDARDMRAIKDNSFDVAFSNSVIEHLGNFSDQARMAGEVRRVAKRYFIQTPNRHFPIEPHAMFPFYHFLPLRMRILLMQNFRLGPIGRFDKDRAVKEIESIRLLTEKELRRLFPDGRIATERFAMLTKSFVVYKM